MRKFLSAALVLFVTACGEASVERVTQSASDLGGAALEAATEVVDTRTACVLAGQPDVFCGCVQQRLGPRLTRAHVESLTSILRDAQAEGLETAAETARNADPAVRNALAQCATNAALQSVVGAGEN
jgi:hypothetical protein